MIEYIGVLTAGGVAIPGEGGLPMAPELHANQTVAWAMIVIAYVIFAGTLTWALWRLARRREMLPVILVVAGLLACNLEPLGDYVGAIVYANDLPWFSYTIMGRRMPAFILIGAASYVVFGGYIAYRYIRDGRPLKDLFILSAIWVGIPEVIVEIIWYHYGLIAYYANPTRILGVPLYTIIQNTTLLPIYGIVVFYAVKYLKGQRLWLLVLLMPAVTIGYIVGGTAWTYQAVQSSWPAWVVWGTSAFSIATAIVITMLLLNIPELRQLRDERARLQTTHPGSPTPHEARVHP